MTQNCLLVLLQIGKPSISITISTERETSGRDVRGRRYFVISCYKLKYMISTKAGDGQHFQRAGSERSSVQGVPSDQVL